MSADKSKDIVETGKPAKTGPVKPTPPPAPKLPPFFRRIDWVTFGITALLVFIGYFLTLAPDVTLEDSGELATGSFYAGVPHPPGYPLWSIITYFFANFLPVANVAYRVAVASAVAGALASGLLALLVSRGGSMILEGIPDFKELPRRMENFICCVAGVSAGLMLAFNGYMWSQSVIVEVYPLSVLSLMVVCCLVLRWMYAPHQRRYIYWAWLVFGICFTNHQTLIVAAMGLEGAVIAAQPKLGRDLMLWNSVIYVIGLFVFAFHMLGQFEPSDMVIRIFHIVGLCSVGGCIWLSITTKEFPGRLSLCVWAMFLLWAVGAAIYFYMPITSMTNPPMNWGYPRTWDGFLHALTRGQYEKTNPTNFFSDPMRLFMQMGMYCKWATEELNLVNLSLAVIPILYFFRMQRRERAWLVGLAGIWFCLAVVLLILLNPQEDRAAQSLNKVFFASSYTMIALYIGYGLTIIAASLVTQYKNFRFWALCGGGIALTLALVTLYSTAQNFGGNADLSGMGKLFHEISKSFQPHQYGLPIHAGMVLVALTALFLLVIAVCREKALIGVVLVIFALLPLHSIMSHWADNEERGHWFGYWFGHDMFTAPYGIYPEMTRNAILFGGTDPGRFCPTYMIFCESMIPHNKQPKEDQKFDRRDVYIITQNALADPTYLEYIRAQYNRSTQIDPPFFQEMFRSKKEEEQNYTTNFIARLAYQLLDKPLTAFGKRVEDRRRADLIYPPKEIYTPTADDSTKCFNDYMADAQQRLTHDMQFPNEPKQLKQGEDVHVIPGDNRVSVSGQVAVMSINGLLTKVIFDHNPDNEFFVEESFPLDWMYPYLSPFGNIMKINRQPLAEITPDMIKKDHQFWSEYSDRFIGNWITYNTSVKEVAAFVEKVYLEHDYTGFKGDLRFIRDDVAQKSFSKLRSSIGGIYDWRFRHGGGEDQQRMLKEAEFAFLQAFAYCPYSPEAVFRYVNLLLSNRKVDDALLVAEACLKLDPNNGSVQVLVNQLHDMKSHGGGVAVDDNSTVEALETEVAKNPTNIQASFNLAGAYLQRKQTDRAVAVLDNVFNSPTVQPTALVFLAQAYAQIHDYPRLEKALEKLTVLDPHSPEAWCDLAAMKIAMNKPADAMTDLTRSVSENAARLARDPKASNLLPLIRKDQRFTSLHGTPEFQKLVGQ